MPGLYPSYQFNKSKQHNSQTMQTAALSLEYPHHIWLQMLERYDSSLRANHPLDTTAKKNTNVIMNVV